MTFTWSTLIKHIFHPFFQLALGGVLLLVIAFPTDALAGNLIDKAIELVNQERTKVGLSPLVENSLLQKAAEAKADDMLKNDYFAHTSPLGQNPWYWLRQVGYEYKSAGENLAINYDDAKAQHKAWMKSETHRANIMNSQFQEIGMATRHGRINGQEATVTVQLFGTPRTVGVAKKPQAPETPPAAKPAVEGVETQVVAPDTLTVPQQATSGTRVPTEMVLFNPTVWEHIQQSHFIADQVWLVWAELFVTLVFMAVALALPILFVGIMRLKLREAWQHEQQSSTLVPDVSREPSFSMPKRRLVT